MSLAIHELLQLQKKKEKKREKKSRSVIMASRWKKASSAYLIREITGSGAGPTSKGGEPEKRGEG